MVIQRIETLKEIDKWLEEGGDKSKLRGNVKAVIDAYKAKKLKWTPGLVTYWSKGVQVSEPRPWDIEENATIAMHFGGNEDFWVEEVSRCLLWSEYNPDHTSVKLNQSKSCWDIRGMDSNST